MITILKYKPTQGRQIAASGGLFSFRCARLLSFAVMLGCIAVGAQAEQRDKLVLGGPGAVVSYPLMHMVHTQALKAHAKTVEFRLWDTHDQLNSLLAHKQLDFSASPTTLPALLANRGQSVRLLNVSVWGLIWLISTDPKVKGFQDLATQELLSPFQHDLGDVLIDTLLTSQQTARQEGESVQLRRTRSGQDAIALMLSGKGQHVALAEPLGSMLLWRSESQTANGKSPKLYRVQSLEEAWAQQYPKQPTLPQAGLMANGDAALDAALTRAVDEAYANSARWCKANALGCAEIANRHLPHIPVAVLRNAIEITHLESRTAQNAKSEIEALYRLIQQKHPKVIGNQLPPEKFYGP
ncbi:substrate-binding domain-containing protein [Diaphorobacter caeni]|uniref:ABC transporter substrate-binding protein n=1 Tax=Diaphorobacter caeni TaxID=2784387 RepID=UPI001E3BC5AD|nr:ABC transporter substrate-binding protein [Diaphorobacter caeni]